MALVCVENRWTMVLFCSSVQAELLPPPKADLWVTGELFPSTSAITFPLHHGKDAARAPRGTAAKGRTTWGAEGCLIQVQHCCPRRSVHGLQVSLADAAHEP